MTYRDVQSAKQLSYAKRIAAALEAELSELHLSVLVGLRPKENLLYVAVEPKADCAELPSSERVLPAANRAFLRLRSRLNLGWAKLIRVMGRSPVGFAEASSDRPSVALPAWQGYISPTADRAPAGLLHSSEASKTDVFSADRSVLTGSEPDQSMDWMAVVSGRSYGYCHGNGLGGVLHEVRPPQILERSTPVALGPPPQPQLFDRQTVLPVIKEAISQKQQVELYAGPGIGKTALVRHLAHDADLTARFPDGVVYLSVNQQDAEDIVQMLYRAFYSAPLPLKVTYKTARQALLTKQALVLFDDLSLTPTDVERLLAVLPECAVVLVSQARFYRQAQTAIALKGLPFQDALRLLQNDLETPLAEAEVQAAKRLWTALLGNARQLSRAAAYVRSLSPMRQLATELSELEKAPTQNTSGPALPLTAFVQSVQSNSAITLSARGLFQAVAYSLSLQQQQVLALMGAMAGVALSKAAIATITQQPDVDTVLNDLVSLHLLEGTSAKRPFNAETSSNLPCYWLSHDLKVWAAQMFEPEPWLLGAIAYFTGAPSEDARAMGTDDLEARLHLLEWTQRTGHWQQSLALIKQLDYPLATAGQWSRWRQVLTYGLQAAEQLGEAEAEAWALHQLGTQALAAGQMNRAAGWLSRAVRLRSRLKDTEGAARSRHNLALIPPALVSGQGAPAGPYRPYQQRLQRQSALVASGVLAAGVTLLGLMLWPRWSAARQLQVSEDAISFGDRVLTSASDPRPVTLANPGRQPLKIEQVSLTGNSDFSVLYPGACQPPTVLAPAEICELQTIFEPTAVGKRAATVTVVSRVGDRQATHKVSLAGTGSAASQAELLRFSAERLNFGKAVLNRQARQVFQLTNEGGRPLTITGLEVTGAHAAEFGVLREDCLNALLDVGESCGGEVWFEPARGGDRTAQLLASSDTDQLVALPLQGSGVSAKRSTPSLPPLAFPPNSTDSTSTNASGTALHSATEQSSPSGSQSPSAQGASSDLATIDDQITVTAGASSVIDVLSNDRIPATDTVVAVAIVSAPIGSATVEGNQIIYQATEGITSDRFTYQVQLASGTTATATVSINIGTLNPPIAPLPSVKPPSSEDQPIEAPLEAKPRPVPDILPEASSSPQQAEPNGSDRPIESVPPAATEAPPSQ